MSNVESSEEAVLELIALIRDTPLASLDDVDLDALRAALPGPPLKATEGDNKKATLAGASPLLFAEDVSEQQKVISLSQCYHATTSLFTSVVVFF